MKKPNLPFELWICSLILSGFCGFLSIWYDEIYIVISSIIFVIISFIMITNVSTIDYRIHTYTVFWVLSSAFALFTLVISENMNMGVITIIYFLLAPFYLPIAALGTYVRNTLFIPYIISFAFAFYCVAKIVKLKRG